MIKISDRMFSGTKTVTYNLNIISSYRLYVVKKHAFISKKQINNDRQQHFQVSWYIY